MLVDSERYLFACSRYIEMNPVRAGIVSDPAAYRWSSFRCNAGDDPDAIVTPHPAYRALGGSATDRQAAYRALFDVPLDAGVIDTIRRAARMGAVLGTAQCRARLETALNRRLARLPHGGARRGQAFAAEDHAVGQPPDHHRFSTTLTP
jgi:putative transposase